jgi:hypothetical protein
MRNNAIQQQAYPIGHDRLHSFVLSANWSVEEAFALLELLGQMREQLLSQYGDHLIEFINEQQCAAYAIAAE